MKDYTIFEDVRYINNLLTRRSVEKNFLTPTENLTRANTLIIKYLVNNSGKDIFQKDIENKFGITKSTASTVLKHMEEKGFIKRKSINKDARYKKLIPTKKAEEIHAQTETVLLADQRLLLYNFSPEELTSFKNLLTKLKTNIKEINEKEKLYD